MSLDNEKQVRQISFDQVFGPAFIGSGIAEEFSLVWGKIVDHNASKNGDIKLFRTANHRIVGAAVFVESEERQQLLIIRFKSGKLVDKQLLIIRERFGENIHYTHMLLNILEDRVYFTGTIGPNMNSLNRISRFLPGLDYRHTRRDVSLEGLDVYRANEWFRTNLEMQNTLPFNVAQSH